MQQPIIKSLADISKVKVPEVGQLTSFKGGAKGDPGHEGGDPGRDPDHRVHHVSFLSPVMGSGFEAYLDLLYNHQGLFWELMEKNQAFAIGYANAQLEAGATAMAYFDPLSSPTIIGREKFIETGFPIMKQTLAALKGPGVVHFASGRCLQILDKVMETPAVGVGVSSPGGSHRAQGEM